MFNHQGLFALFRQSADMPKLLRVTDQDGALRQRGWSASTTPIRWRGRNAASGAGSPRKCRMTG